MNSEQSLTTFPDYRAMLRAELEARTQKNPRYSLRAFARDLTMTPQILSLVLNGKKGVSVETAARIAEELSWTPDRALYFCDLVLATQTRSVLVRKMLERRIRGRQSGDSSYELLQEDIFKSMANWYHLPLLELTLVKDFQSTPPWIARRLGISLIEAKEAIQRLIRLGLLEELTEDGVTILRKARGDTTTSQDVPSQAIRTFHKQLLSKAQESVDSQAVTERDLSAIVVPIDLARIPEAKQKIETFRKSMAEFLDQGSRSEVYALGIQFFRLSKQNEALL